MAIRLFPSHELDKRTQPTQSAVEAGIKTLQANLKSITDSICRLEHQRPRTSVSNQQLKRQKARLAITQIQLQQCVAELKTKSSAP